MRALLACLILFGGVAPAVAQQPATPGTLVPRDVPPGAVAPDPGITVPERIIPAPRGSGADVQLPPSSSDRMAVPPARPDAAVVPHGGGDPGILAPATPAKPPD